MRITFISVMAGSPWGGSELLWSQTALRLAQMGHRVSASIVHWPQRAAPVFELLGAGVEINQRKLKAGPLGLGAFGRLFQGPLNALVRRASKRAFGQWLSQQQPELICISNGWIGDEQGVLDYCRRTSARYAIVVQANSEHWWPDDAAARRLIEIYKNAARVYFVSEGNHRLLETQLGIQLSNKAVVRNPFNLSRAISLPWPGEEGSLRLACIGRLDPAAKGQDLLLRVLANEPWLSRPIRVSFYGEGPSEASLRRLAVHLGLGERVQFCGHLDDIEQIWSTHHALVLPSRYEGLPLVIVEAMLCGRPIITTDVAGHVEIVEDGVTGFIAEAPTVRHLQLAMERAWTKRDHWKEMGTSASVAIRKLVPADPVAEFARSLTELTAAEQAGRRESQG